MQGGRETEGGVGCDGGRRQRGEGESQARRCSGCCSALKHIPSDQLFSAVVMSRGTFSSLNEWVVLQFVLTLLIPVR